MRRAKEDNIGVERRSFEFALLSKQGRINVEKECRLK